MGNLGRKISDQLVVSIENKFSDIFLIHKKTIGIALIISIKYDIIP